MPLDRFVEPFPKRCVSPDLVDDDGFAVFEEVVVRQFERFGNSLC